jgi:hypothetical protein
MAGLTGKHRNDAAGQPMKRIAKMLKRSALTAQPGSGDRSMRRGRPCMACRQSYV